MSEQERIQRQRTSRPAPESQDVSVDTSRGEQLKADLDELLELADRILVMAGGRVVYETDAATADRMLIGQHMAGHA